MEAISTAWLHYLYAPGPEHAEAWGKQHWARGGAPHTPEQALAEMGGKAHPGNLYRVRVIPAHQPDEKVQALASSVQVEPEPETTPKARQVVVSGRFVKGEVYKLRGIWRWFSETRGTETYARGSTLADVRDHIARVCRVRPAEVVFRQAGTGTEMQVSLSVERADGEPEPAAPVGPSHLKIESDQPHVLIPDNEHGIAPGWRDLVRLLRENADKPDVVRFLADMLEI